jgi:hypothetical protein
MTSRGWNKIEREKVPDDCGTEYRDMKKACTWKHWFLRRRPTCSTAKKSYATCHRDVNFRASPSAPARKLKEYENVPQNCMSLYGKMQIDCTGSKRECNAAKEAYSECYKKYIAESLRQNGILTIKNVSRGGFKSRRKRFSKLK